jgi:hypothetical protein
MTLWRWSPFGRNCSTDMSGVDALVCSMLQGQSHRRDQVCIPTSFILFAPGHRDERPPAHSSARTRNSKAGQADPDGSATRVTDGALVWAEVGKGTPTKWAARLPYNKDDAIYPPDGSAAYDLWQAMNAGSSGDVYAQVNFQILSRARQ